MINNLKKKKKKRNEHELFTIGKVRKVTHTLNPKLDSQNEPTIKCEMKNDNRLIIDDIFQFIWVYINNKHTQLNDDDIFTDTVYCFRYVVYI